MYSFVLIIICVDSLFGIGNRHSIPFIGMCWLCLASSTDLKRIETQRSLLRGDKTLQLDSQATLQQKS